MSVNTRNLIYCPKCKLDAREKVIAELFPSGTVAIARQRTKYSYEEVTFVSGTDFQLTCGYCRTVVYVHQEPKEVVDYGTNITQTIQGSHIRYEWIHRISFGPGTVSQELQRSPHNAGTTLFA